MIPGSENEVSVVFNEKMNSARFFYDKLEIPKMLATDDQVSEIINYVDAVMFEFYAALQQLLQLLNLKANLSLMPNLVGRPAFFKELKKSQEELYCWWSSANSTPEVRVLGEYRHAVTHRTSSILIFAEKHEGNGTTIVVSLPVHFEGGKSVDILHQLQRIGEKLNQLHEELRAK